MNEFQDRVRGSKKSLKKLDKMDFLKHLARKEQFMFALAYAMKKNIRPEPLSDSGSFFHSKNLDKEEDIPLINAAVYYITKKLDILVDDQEKIRIAEEYANGGISYLYEEYISSQYGKFEKKLERNFFEMYNELNIDL